MAESEHFNENEILTQDRRDKNAAMSEMLDHGSACIALTSVNWRSMQQQQLLTGIAAAFIPPAKALSLRQSCDLLGINRKAAYVARGMQFRLEHDAFMLLSGPINPGEPVDFRDGYGVVKEINAQDDSITITQYPWKVDTTYSPISVARMRRREPDLLDFRPKTRSDTVPETIQTTIYEFHIAHNPQSPNAKDQMSRRHPEIPRLKQSAPTIYRYETWDQLWLEFKRNHPGIAAQIANNNQPNECPMALRTYAPWNMVKGKDSSCLCVNCEVTNAIKRGSKATLKILLPATVSDKAMIFSEGKTDDERDAENDRMDSIAAGKLTQIYDVLNQSSKYDMCVKCLPCLASKKLEDAKEICINGTCAVCGFDKM